MSLGASRSVVVDTSHSPHAQLRPVPPDRGHADRHLLGAAYARQLGVHPPRAVPPPRGDAPPRQFPPRGGQAAGDVQDEKYGLGYRTGRGPRTVHRQGPGGEGESRGFSASLQAAEAECRRVWLPVTLAALTGAERLTRSKTWCRAVPCGPQRGYILRSGRGSFVSATIELVPPCETEVSSESDSSAF